MDKLYFSDAKEKGAEFYMHHAEKMLIVVKEDYSSYYQFCYDEDNCVCQVISIRKLEDGETVGSIYGKKISVISKQQFIDFYNACENGGQGFEDLIKTIL